MNELAISFQLTKVYIILLQISQKYHCEDVTYSNYDINVVIRNFVKIGHRVRMSELIFDYRDGPGIMEKQKYKSRKTNSSDKTKFTKNGSNIK